MHFAKYIIDKYLHLHHKQNKYILKKQTTTKTCFMMFYSEMTILRPQFSFCSQLLRYKMFCFQS